MDDLITRFWSEIAARPTGPMAVRLYLQPAMAAFFAIRDGLKDAREGRPAYLETLVANSSQRASLLRQGWKSVGRVFVLAMIMDLIYQAIELHGIRPIETILVAAVLAIVPYVLLRGPVNRIVSMRKHGRTGARRAA